MIKSSAPFSRQPSGSGAWEDPFLYTDVRGNWHILIHAYNLSDNSRMSGHYFSRDGVTWHATGLEPYGFHVAMTNGSTMLTSTRERPKLVLDSSGNVLALINGVSTNYDCKGWSKGRGVGELDWTGNHPSSFSTSLWASSTGLPPPPQQGRRASARWDLERTGRLR